MVNLYVKDVDVGRINVYAALPGENHLFCLLSIVHVSGSRCVLGFVYARQALLL